MQIAEVGVFRELENHWEGYPEALGGALLSIESAEVLPGHQERCRHVCANWQAISSLCLAYIEAKRSAYGLAARHFTGPGVFVTSADQWCVFFDTEHEIEAVVGVEFRGDEPLQLIIGD